MNYTIIGNGVAGTTAALTIREREPSADIVLIGGEHDYFFSRTALMYAYMDLMTIRDLEPYERKVYDKQRIQRIRNRVTALDPGSHRITFEDGSARTYGRLLIAAGSSPRRPTWPGLESVREGAVNFVSLQDLQRCEALTRKDPQAVVVGGGLIGIELAECLRHHGIPVTYLVRESWFYAHSLNSGEGAMVSRHIRKHGIDLRPDTEVGSVAVSSGGTVKAVETTAGETIPCGLLGIAIGVVPAVEWLRTSAAGIAVNRGVVVDPALRTSAPDIWAAGDCAEITPPSGTAFVEQMWYSAKRQGALAANSMLDDIVQYARPTFHNSAKFFEMEYTAVGRMTSDEGSDFYAALPGKDVSVRIHGERGVVLGFSLLGSRWNHEPLVRWIEQRRTLDYVLSNLTHAQFDVEFGRTNIRTWDIRT